MPDFNILPVPAAGTIGSRIIIITIGITNTIKKNPFVMRPLMERRYMKQCFTKKPLVVRALVMNIITVLPPGHKPAQVIGPVQEQGAGTGVTGLTRMMRMMQLTVVT